MVTKFKFIVFLIFILLQVGNIAFAQPAISIEPGNIGFNDVWSHISYTRTLRITNSGNANLVILSFNFTGADGSLFSFVTNPNLPMTLAPSQNIELEVRFVSNTVGAKNGVLNIHDTSGSSSAVSLSANVVGISVEVTPNAIDFGNIAVGSQSENRTVTVTNTGINDITITGISINGEDAISFIVNPFSVTLSPGENRNIPVAFSPTSAGGKKSTLSIMITIESFHSTWDISLRGNMTNAGIPVISINRNSISFGTIRPEKSSTPVAVRITNYGNAPLVISFSVTENVFRLPNGETEIAIDSFSSYDIYVQFSPTVAQYYTGTLTLTHNASGLPVNILLSGTGGASQIMINPTSISFGSIAIGSSSRELVRISNNGFATLVISSVSITGTEFILPNNETMITIEPGEYHDLYIQFSPTIAGSYSGYITLTHNVTGGSSTIPLNGECLGDGSGGTPNIKVDPFPEIRFEDIVVGTVHTMVVTITNTGTAPFIINSASIEGEDKESYVFTNIFPSVFIAGGIRNFMVRYQPLIENRSTSVNANLKINHNIISRPPIVINLTGLSYVIYDTQPDHIDFGTVQIGSQIDTAIYVTNMSPVDIILYGSTYRNSEEATSSFIITPPLPFSLPLIVDETQRIPVSFKPILRGPLEYELVIGGEAGGGGNMYRFTGIGIDGASTIEVYPTNINFGNVNVESSPQIIVKITNSGNVPIDISTSITRGVFTLPNNENTITIPVNGYYDLCVQFSPNEAMAYNGSLTLTHNVKGLLSIIPLNGLGILSGLAGIVGVVSEIDFGEVFLETVKDTFTIINNGNIVLTINSAQIVGTDAGDFELEVISSVTIPAGESRNFTLRFQPTSLGEKTATIEIYHNNSLVPSPVYVTLLGTGILSSIPIVVIEPPNIYFDDVLVGSSLQRSLRITNNGDATLVISSFDILPSAFTLIDGETTITVSAGEYRDITVQFSPIAVQTYNGTLTLMHNTTGGSSSVQLSGRGVQPSITIPPNISFGDVTINSASTENITIKNDGTVDFIITQVSISGDGFTLPSNENTTVNLENPITVLAGTSSTITVQFLPTVVGSYSGSVTFDHNVPGSPDTVHLIGRGITTSADVIPNAINFGDVQLGSESDSVVYVINRGTIYIDITRVNITNGDDTSFIANSVSVTIGPDESEKISVSFKPTSLGSKQATLNITTSVGVFTVQLTGNGAGTAVIVIDPKSIDFGNIIVGDSSQKNVSIRNDGNVDLEILSMNFAGTDANLFTFTPNPPIIIPPSIDTTLTIQFLLTSVGVKNAELNIVHNGSVIPSVVPLTGRGITVNVDVIPNAINFGNVQLDSQSYSAVYVTNTGTIDINIVGVNLTGGDTTSFIANSISVTLSPDESEKIPISFKPISLGSKQATLNIITSVGTFTIQLTGNGSGTPIIEINSTSINFGDVLVPSLSSKTFRITNDGNAELIISSMNLTDVDAGLFSFTPSSLIIIRPTESRDITVQFLPTSMGVKNAKLNIVHNAKGSPSTVILTGRGVQAEISLNPSDNIDFGGVHVNSSSDNKYITISNTGTAPFTITNLQITGADASMFKRISFPDSNSFQNITIEAGLSFVFTFNFTPRSSGAKNARVIFTHSFDSSEVALIGVGLVPSISVTPNPLDFGDVLINSSKTESITIQNNGTVDLVISGVSISGDVFILQNVTTPITITAGESITIAVQFSSTATIGSYTGTLTLWHNATGTPSIIQLTGRGVRAGITIDSTSINFGDINIGSSSQRFVRITNNGNLPLHISSFTISPNVFTLTNGETIKILEPGAEHYLYVEFSPTTAKDYTGAITLIHNAIGSPSYIPLTGKGIGPSIIIEPTSINFGEIQIGRSSQRNVKITNGGSAPLVISSVSINGDVFTLSNKESTISISPGGNQYITVQFLPNAAIEYTGSIILTHNANLTNNENYNQTDIAKLDTIDLCGNGIISDVNVSISKNYMVKPNEDVKVSVQVMDDLNEKNAKSFSFVLQYNKRILSVRDVSLIGTVSRSLTYSIEGSTPGELVIRVTNNEGEPLIGIGSLIDINFIGLRGDSCGTHLILESFTFNSDGPNVITENGYCELFWGCGEDQTYVTTDRSTFLFQNNPNPVKEGYESTIQYRINTAGETSLTVYDIIGREIAKLVNEYKSEGTYSVTFNTKGLPSGVYLYKLKAPGYEGLNKMVVIR